VTPRRKLLSLPPESLVPSPRKSTWAKTSPSSLARIVRTLAISQLLPTVILTWLPTCPDIATDGSLCDWNAASVAPSMRIWEPEPAISTTSPMGDSFSAEAAFGAAAVSSLKLLTSLRNSRRFGCSSISAHSSGLFRADGLTGERLKLT
jgi:hypothetical protein